MGRRSGYLALGAAYGQPDIILIPEHPLNRDRLVERVLEVYELQKNAVIVCAEGMVDEAEVVRLHRVLRMELGGVLAGDVARRAGVRTADYLLANRIPTPVQLLLRLLPARLAAWVLLRAITRHAWTFSGSGVFVAKVGRPVVLTIRNNPLCVATQSEQPVCDFYAASFERLFRVLVHPQARVTETDCEACGASACRFEVRW